MHYAASCQPIYLYTYALIPPKCGCWATIPSSLDDMIQRRCATNQTYYSTQSIDYTTAKPNNDCQTPR